MKVPLCSGRTGSITNVAFSWKAPFNSGNQTIGSALPCPLITSQSNVALEFLATLARGGVTLRKARCPACALGVSGIISRKKLATGWMLHLNVRGTNCLLNNMSFGIVLEKRRPHDIDRPEDIALTYVADFFEPYTKEHVKEAIGVTHNEMKHLACCTALKSPFSKSARFFVSYNLHFFCSIHLLARQRSRLYLRSKLLGRQFENQT